MTPKEWTTLITAGATLLGAVVGTAIPTIFGQLISNLAASRARKDQADEARNARDFQFKQAELDRTAENNARNHAKALEVAQRREERLRLIRAERVTAYQEALKELGRYASVLDNTSEDEALATMHGARDRALAASAAIIDSDVASAAADCCFTLDKILNHPGEVDAYGGAGTAHEAVASDMTRLRNLMEDRTRFWTLEQEEPKIEPGAESGAPDSTPT